MKQILSTSWGRNLLAAVLAAVLFTLLGLLVGASPSVTLFAAAIFGTMLVLIVQIGEVIGILMASHGTQNDMGETMVAEVESPAGQQEVKRMSFGALLTVAVVQELHLSLFKRDRPLWAFEFLGIAEGIFPPREYGTFNRYLEWMLMIAMGAMTLVASFLLASFVYSTALPSNAIGLTFILSFIAFLIGLLVFFPVALFITSVIRRLFILYATRATLAQIND